jgi:hypothetical protein
VAFTYDSSLPTARDRIRFAVWDTDTANQLRSDETIDAMIAEFGETAATAKIARSLANQFAQMPSSVTIPNGPSVTWGERVRAWLALAQAIEADTGGVSSAPLDDGFRTRSFATTTEYRHPLELTYPGN